MTSYTLPRATVEQALEALESVYGDSCDALHALRAALAQQAEPTVPSDRADSHQPPGCDHCNHPLYAATRCRVCGRVTEQAEPVEPVAWSGYDLDGMVEAFSRVIEAHHSSKHPFHNPIDMDARMALRILRGFIPAMKAYAALAQQAEPVEPVAWGVDWGRDGDRSCVSITKKRADGTMEVVAVEYGPLYTAPPQRKPLTEGALMGVYIDFDRTADTAWSGVEYLLRLCRAVERAHGIGDNP